MLRRRGDPVDWMTRRHVESLLAGDIFNSVESWTRHLWHRVDLVVHE